MTEATSRPWRTGKGCVIVRVRLTPKSGKDAIDGVRETAAGPAFAARVRAPPRDDEANGALVRLLAGRLGVPSRAVHVTGAHKARVKSCTVEGGGRDLERRLVDLWSELNQEQTNEEDECPCPKPR